MDILFTIILVFLGVLSIIDLFVGVSNDAVNFLNSAVGAKAAPFRTVLIVAAIGVFIGAALSNGMMDIARHGIYNPSYFSFREVMIICLTAMISDVILLNIFNTLGLPTSTTVTMVFNLLGSAFTISMLKISGDTTGSLELMELINTSKALQVIVAIFMSVVIAIFFGTLVMWISRVIFSFNYKKNLKYFSGLFGGLAITAIIYFMIFQGLKESAFMTPEYKQWLSDNTLMLLSYIFVGSAVVMQILNAFKVNIFKVIILAGTLALSLAFAGNDLVNFIGVPLSGLSAFQDYMAHGAGDYNNYLMGANNGPSTTHWGFLIFAGAVMVTALVFSKSAHNVIKTSVNLSRQDDGEEAYGTSRISQGLVRVVHTASKTIAQLMPTTASKWIDSRFNKQDIILEEPGAAFDLVRASVTLVIAALLIAAGTSLKLPLSTTYVTFMVAMGSSLADRAWSRESAVGRLTGVMGVIGGWFVTAGAAFIISSISAVSMYYGGFVVMFILISIAIFMLVSDHFVKRKKGTEEDALFLKILDTDKPEEMWTLLSQHVRMTQVKFLEHVSKDYVSLTDGLLNEDFRTLSRLRSKTEDHKREFKAMRRKETLCLRRIPTDEVLEKSMWFHLGANACLQTLYAIERSTDVCNEHVANNFNPLPEDLRNEFIPVRNQVLEYINLILQMISSGDMSGVKQTKAIGKELKEHVKEMRKIQMKRTHKGERENVRVSLVYMNVLQETNEVLTNLRHLIDYTQHLQVDEDEE